jgi:hypothetical protein
MNPLAIDDPEKVEDVGDGVGAGAERADVDSGAIEDEEDDDDDDEVRDPIDNGRARLLLRGGGGGHVISSSVLTSLSLSSFSSIFEVDVDESPSTSMLPGSSSYPISSMMVIILSVSCE